MVEKFGQAGNNAMRQRILRDYIEGREDTDGTTGPDGNKLVENNADDPAPMWRIKQMQKWAGEFHNAKHASWRRKMATALVRGADDTQRRELATALFDCGVDIFDSSSRHTSQLALTVGHAVSLLQATPSHLAAHTAGAHAGGPSGPSHLVAHAAPHPAQHAAAPHHGTTHIGPQQHPGHPASHHAVHHASPTVVHAAVHATSGGELLQLNS